MPRLKDVCRHVRSKNAGPFWVTIDIFFTDEASYRRFHADAAISVGAIASLYEVPDEDVRRFEIEMLNAVKLSYPRRRPQGGVLERDMHNGQTFVTLMDMELSDDRDPGAGDEASREAGG